MNLKQLQTHTKKKTVVFLGLSFLLLISFQNCRMSGGDFVNKPSSGGGSNNSSSTPPPGTPGMPTDPNAPVANPCPADKQGNPEISNITVVGSGAVATTVTTKSGYTENSGNALSTPVLELSLLKTNVTPVDVCDQSATVQCDIRWDAGATGVLWGTDERGTANNRDIQCVTSSADLDIDVPGRTPTARPSKTTLQIRPRSQDPDVTSDVRVCMEGSATVTVRLRSPYNKNSVSRTFKVNVTNACPKEQKVNAEVEAEAQGLFGESVSISGNRAAVLTTGLNAYAFVNVGGVRIYENNGSSWVYSTTVIPPTAELENNVKPNIVLLSGNYLFIGNAALGNQSGRVWFFQRDGSGNWSKVQTLDGGASSKFGTSLAFESNRLFVGAPSVSGVGAVHVYTLSSGTFSATSSISGVDVQSDFGASLAVSGSRLVIGAPGSAVNTSTTGTFHQCNIANISAPTCSAWVLTNNRVGNEVIPVSSRLGSSVALKNNLLLVSAKNWYPSNMATPPAIRNGWVALIDLNGGGSNASVRAFRGGGEEQMGSAIAFGNTSFFIGAKEALSKRGRVYQMALPSDGSVNTTLRFNYYALNQGPLDRFGSALAVSGNFLLVGAPLDQELGYSTAGSATFFNVIAP